MRLSDRTPTNLRRSWSRALGAALALALGACARGESTLHDAPVALSLSSASAVEARVRGGVVRWELGGARWIERVGVAVTSEASAPPRLWVRAGIDDAAGWQALEVTFFEAGAANYRLDLRRLVGGLELRIDEAALTSLRIELVDARVAADADRGADVRADEGAGSVSVRRADAIVSAPPFVHERNEWGARAVGTCGKDHDPGYVTYHHTDTPVPDPLTPEARLRQIQDFHIEVRGWCDIGYHFLVSQDGRVWRGRASEARTGAHVGDHNTGNVGVALLGAYQTTGAADVMLRAASRTLGWLSGAYFIPRSRETVLGHREWPDQSTTCPGDELLRQLGAIIEATFDRDLDGAAGYDDCDDADPVHASSCAGGPLPLPTPVDLDPVTPPADLPANTPGEDTESAGATPDGGTSERDGDDEGGCAATTPHLSPLAGVLLVAWALRPSGRSLRSPRPRPPRQASRPQ